MNRRPSPRIAARRKVIPPGFRRHVMAIGCETGLLWIFEGFSRFAGRGRGAAPGGQIGGGPETGPTFRAPCSDTHRAVLFAKGLGATWLFPIGSALMSEGGGGPGSQGSATLHAFGSGWGAGDEASILSPMPAARNAGPLQPTSVYSGGDGRVGNLFGLFCQGSWGVCFGLMARATPPMPGSARGQPISSWEIGTSDSPRTYPFNPSKTLKPPATAAQSRRRGRAFSPWRVTVCLTRCAAGCGGGRVRRRSSCR